MSNIKVLFIRSNPVEPDPRVEKTARALYLSGYEVRVLGWDRSGVMDSSQDREFGKLELLSISAPYGSGIRNLPAALRWQYRLLVYLARNRRKLDVIHACDFDTVLPALLAQAALRKKVVYDMFDFYAEHLRATPRFVKWVVRHLELWAIGRVDAVILADDARKTQIRGSKPLKLTVVYNAPEDRSQDLVASETEYSEAVGFVLAYVGLLQVERGLLEVLQAFQAHLDWRLDLAGFGGDETAIVKRAEALPKVRFHGRVPYERSLELMGLADALIATYDPSIPNHRYASPNKLFEAMMLAKPIVVAEGTNMDRIVEEHGCGLVVPYGDVPALEAALARLADDPELRERLGQAGRRAYEARYSWKIMQERLLGLYSQL